jgi:hypothetical protein
MFSKIIEVKSYKIMCVHGKYYCHDIIQLREFFGKKRTDHRSY